MKWHEIIKESNDVNQMDSLLQQCLDKIYSHWDGNVNHGAVAAALMIPGREPIIEVSYKQPDDMWIHAERHVINQTIEQYGAVPPNSIMVSTLEPCFDAMPNRIGCSCSKLIGDNGIEKVYAGLHDHMQEEIDPHYKHPFEIQYSENPGIKFECTKLFDTIPPVNTKP